MHNSAIQARQGGGWLWPALGATLFFLALTVLMLWQSLRLTEGNLVYALDDAYIHMAISKHFAQAGIWGITPFEWSSSSSSPLWGLILAAFTRLFGDAIVWPLLLNLVSAIVLLFFCAWATYGLRPAERVSKRARWYLLAVLIVVVVAVPLPTLVLMGMEHTLQSLLVVVAGYFLITHLRRENEFRRHSALALALLAPLMTATRYELFFAVGAIFLLLLWQRQWRLALLIVALAAIPPLLYAWDSTSRGWFALPNSVLMKSVGNIELLPQLLGYSFYEIATLPLTHGTVTHRFLFLFPLIAVPLCLWLDRHKGTRNASQLALLFFGIIWFWHLQFVYEGYFYRYEAYAIGLACFAFGLKGQDWLFGDDSCLGPYKRSAVWATALILLLMVSFGLRGIRAMSKSATATMNIYHQHIQMARFVHNYYPNGNVAVNDIGAINYFNDVHLLDVWGLGSPQIAEAYLTGRYTPQLLQQVALEHDSDLIIIYDIWFRRRPGEIKDEIGTNWVKVATWRIPDNVVASEDTVAFYAINEVRAATLEANLRAFESELPPEVTVEVLTDYAP